MMYWEQYNMNSLVLFFVVINEKIQRNMYVDVFVEELWKNLYHTIFSD